MGSKSAVNFARLFFRFLDRHSSGVTAVETAIVFVLLLVLVCGVVDFSAIIWSRHMLADVVDDGARSASLITPEGRTTLEAELNASLRQLPFLTNTSVVIQGPQAIGGTTQQQGFRVTASAQHRFYFLPIIGIQNANIQEISRCRSELQPDQRATPAPGSTPAATATPDA